MGDGGRVRDTEPQTHGLTHLIVTRLDKRTHVPVLESSHLESAYVGGHCIFFSLNVQLFLKKILNQGDIYFLFTLAFTTSVFFPLCSTFLQPEKLPFRVGLLDEKADFASFFF